MSYKIVHVLNSSVSGLKDQLEAFKFIKKIIRNFGGDPNKITIFGESAGGSSVHYHMLSQQSKGKAYFIWQLTEVKSCLPRNG